MRIKNKKSEMEQALSYVERELGQLNLSRSDATASMLMAEKSILVLMVHAPEDSEIEITLKKRFGSVNLTIRAWGEAFDILESGPVLAGLEHQKIDQDIEFAIRVLLILAKADTFRYKNRAHCNTIQILVKQSDWVLNLTIAAVGLAVLLLYSL